LDHQNNYVERSITQTARIVKLFAACLSFLHNYVDDLTKLFSYLLDLVKFLDI